MFCVCHAFLSVQCSLVVTCWDRANFLALLCVELCFVLSLSHVVALVRSGTWLYRFLAFDALLTFMCNHVWRHSAKNLLCFKTVYNKSKTNLFCHGYNVYFISWSERNICISWVARYSWNIYFFASLDGINVIFTPKIWISPIIFKNTIQMSTLQFYDKRVKINIQHS